MTSKIGGARAPMDEGTTVGQIETSMCDKNVDRKNTPGTHSYAKTMNLNSVGGKGGMKTNGTIEGPGVKGAYPNKGPK